MSELQFIKFKMWNWPRIFGFILGAIGGGIPIFIFREDIILLDRLINVIRLYSWLKGGNKYRFKKTVCASPLAVDYFLVDREGLHIFLQSNSSWALFDEKNVIICGSEVGPIFKHYSRKVEKIVKSWENDPDTIDLASIIQRKLELLR